MWVCNNDYKNMTAYLYSINYLLIQSNAPIHAEPITDTKQLPAWWGWGVRYMRQMDRDGRSHSIAGFFSSIFKYAR